MKQLWMVMLMLLFASSYCAAQDEVMSSPAMDQSVQPMPANNYGGQVYGEGAIVEGQSGGSSCGCGGGAIVGSANVDCDCCCAPATYYYNGCGCCGRTYGFRPMFGGFFGRGRGCCCY